MAVPVDEILNPTLKELYEDLYMDYYMEHVKRSFPTFLSSQQEFVVIIRLMAWAVARSYQQPRILKYLYNPDLVMTELLPRLADTLSFTYPLNYPEEQLRILIKYLQKIRRTRGTITSIKQLIRLLETTEKDILNMSFMMYADVQVTSIARGVILIQYNRIQDFDFANDMLRMVMPAGYTWRLESSANTEGLDIVYRNRFDTYSFTEWCMVGGDAVKKEGGAVEESISIDRIERLYEEGKFSVNMTITRTGQPEESPEEPTPDTPPEEEV